MIEGVGLSMIFIHWAIEKVGKEEGKIEGWRGRGKGRRGECHILAEGAASAAGV